MLLYWITARNVFKKQLTFCVCMVPMEVSQSMVKRLRLWSLVTSQRPYTKEATVNITVEDTPVQQVSDFTNIGTIISSDGTIDRKLSARIQKVSGAFNELSNIWKNRNIKSYRKIMIYKAAVLTILLYGSEV